MLYLFAYSLASTLIIYHYRKYVYHVRKKSIPKLITTREYVWRYRFSGTIHDKKLSCENACEMELLSHQNNKVCVTKDAQKCEHDSSECKHLRMHVVNTNEPVDVYRINSTTAKLVGEQDQQLIYRLKSK